MATDVANGGEVCNVLAWGLYDRAFGVDLVYLRGDTCATADIEDGNLVESDVDRAFPIDQSLDTISNLLGSDIKLLVEEAIGDVIDNGSKGSYPYFAGLRFDVDTNAATGSRVSNTEIRSQISGSWVPIDDTKSYTMLTTDDIIQQNDDSNNYSAIILQGTDLTETGMTMKDEFMEYSKEWGLLHPLSK